MYWGAMVTKVGLEGQVLNVDLGGGMAGSVVEMLVWCALAAVLLPRARLAPPNIVIVTADNIGHSDIRSSSTNPPNVIHCLNWFLLQVDGRQ